MVPGRGRHEAHRGLGERRPRNPAWYYNIAANPDRVRIEFAGQRIEVTPEQLHGDEREAAWRQVTTTASGFARYERITDRQIPVIRLTPRPS